MAKKATPTATTLATSIPSILRVCDKCSSAEHPGVHEFADEGKQIEAMAVVEECQQIPTMRASDTTSIIPTAARSWVLQLLYRLSP
jgi:hypothetical protein